MKSITFRPLRYNKKIGKVIAVSYPLWNKVRTANYSRFNLIVDDEYKRLDPESFVHDHKGELLYFFPYNPSEVMAFQRTVIDEEDFDYDEARSLHRDFIVHNDGGRYGQPWTSHFMRGCDCQGTPTFTHHTGDIISRDGYYSMFDFEPLTVKMVRQWLGWFLYQLENSHLQIGK